MSSDTMNPAVVAVVVRFLFERAACTITINVIALLPALLQGYQNPPTTLPQTMTIPSRMVVLVKVKPPSRKPQTPDNVFPKLTHLLFFHRRHHHRFHKKHTLPHTYTPTQIEAEMANDNDFRQEASRSLDGEARSRSLSRSNRPYH